MIRRVGVLLLALSACRSIPHTARAVVCPGAEESLRATVEQSVQRNIGASGSVGPLERSCGGRHVVAVRLPSRDDSTNYGWRIGLLEQDSAGWRVVRTTKGLQDTHRPSLALYEAGNRLLVLADLGDEGGSWGLGTYEIVADSIRDLGVLDVGVPTEENDQSVLERVEVALHNGRWVVHVPLPVVLRPNQDSRKVLRGPADALAVFRYDREAWRQSR